MNSFDNPRREALYRAVSIGSAALSELSSPGVSLRVHSVFASSVNLEVSGNGRLIALTGTSGRAYPHAVVLGCPVDFRTWRLETGSSARVTGGSIRMDGEGLAVTVDLNGALRRLPRSLPRIVGFTSVCRRCATRLTEIQASKRFVLRLDVLLDLRRPVTKEGETLRQAALALGASASALVRLPDRAREAVTNIRLSASSLVGLGTGLTPTGDDFLCGFMAAVRARFFGEPKADRGLLRALCSAVEENLGCTGEISASLLRSTILDHWPEPLLDMADAIADGRKPEALQALEDLCRLGHSSGADIATGFLFGLEALDDRGIDTSVRSLTSPKATAVHRQSLCATQPPPNRGPDSPGLATKPGLAPH